MVQPLKIDVTELLQLPQPFQPLFFIGICRMLMSYFHRHSSSGQLMPGRTETFWRREEGENIRDSFHRITRPPLCE